MKILLSQAEPGDLVFCHSKGFVGAGIRLAEKFRRDWHDASEKPGSNWNHVAVLEECSGPKTQPKLWTVLQAQGRGVTRASLDSVAPRGQFDIVRLPSGACAGSVVRFMRAQVGAKYGFVTVASILLTLFTPRFFNVMKPGTWICSAVAGESMRFGGWLKNWPDVYEVTPAQLWIASQ